MFGLGYVLHGSAVYLGKDTVRNNEGVSVRCVKDLVGQLKENNRVGFMMQGIVNVNKICVEELKGEM